MTEEEPRTENQSDPQGQEPDTMPDSEWDNRVLCSDGNCVGTIGPDGKCRVCGLAYEGELNSKPEEMDKDTSDVEPIRWTQPDENEEKTPTAVDSDTQETHEFDDEWDSRVLCSDGTCIGTIGPDGKCRECGKQYEGG